MNQEVTIRGHDVEQNHFLRLRRYGVSSTCTWSSRPARAAASSRSWVELWEDANGRNRAPAIALRS